MDKIAAYELLLEEHPLWTKEAYVFGASQPDVSEALEPMKSRTRKVKAYAKAKGKEKRTPLGKAVLVGGGLGAGLGGLVGLGAGVPGVIGGVIGGGLTGGFIGGVMSEADANEIKRMKALNRSGKYQQHAVNIGLAQVRARREAEAYEHDRRHREQMRRFDRLERRVDRRDTYGRHYGSPYRY